MPRSEVRRAAVEPIDRVASLLTHADFTADVVQFWENTPAGRWSYLRLRADPADVAAEGIEEFVAKRFGGGKYKVQLRNRATSAYGASVVIDIAGPPKSPAERATFEVTTAATAAPAPAASSAIASNPPHWLQQIIVPIGVTFATAAGSFFAKKLLEGPKTDPLYMELVKNLAKNNAPAPAAAVDPLTMMTNMLDLQDKMEERARRHHRRGDHGPATSLGEVIDKQLPEAFKLIGRKLRIDERMAGIDRTAAAPATTPLPATTAAAADTPPSPDEAPVVAELPTDPLAQLLLRIPIPARRFLLDAAAEEENAEVYAELVLGRLDEDDYDAMRAQLAREDFVDVLLQVVPAYADHRDWFVQLVNAMRAGVEDPEEDAGDTASPTGGLEAGRAHSDASGGTEPGGSRVA